MSLRLPGRYPGIPFELPPNEGRVRSGRRGIKSRSFPTKHVRKGFVQEQAPYPPWSVRSFVVGEGSPSGLVLGHRGSVVRVRGRWVG